MRTDTIASLIAVLVLAAPALAEAPPAGSWNGDASFVLAQKHLNHDDWAPTEDQGELGVQTNWQGPDWPVALAADLLFSGDEEDVSRGPYDRQRGTTSELDLGARKVWRPGEHVRPYVGGGLGIIGASLKLSGPGGSIEDHDTGVGLWLGGGVFWTLNKALDLGVDVRLSGARVRLFGEDRNAGGLHLGALVGYHWGG